MTDLEVLAKNIRMYRHLKNLWQGDLAKQIGMTKDYISKIELGKQRNPGLQPLVKISQVLNVELSQLFMPDPEAINIRFIVGSENLASLEKLLNEVKKRVEIRFKVDTKKPIFYHGSDCECVGCREKRGEKNEG